jgi:NADH dehydrogenase FAD-containing subunit
VDAKPIETDYLVIGGGATAMAFVDTLLSESDAEIVMVDRNHRPGGPRLSACISLRLSTASILAS